MGMADGRIPDSQITASSEFGHPGSHGPANGRLNRPHSPGRTGSWSASANTLGQWLQVDLGDSRPITGVVTQGRSISEPHQQWVTKYLVMYSNDGETWSYVENSDVGRVSIG